MTAVLNLDPNPNPTPPAQVAKEELTVGGRLSADRELGLDELDSKLEDMERELLELNANSERLTRRCDRPPIGLSWIPVRFVSPMVC